MERLTRRDALKASALASLSAFGAGAPLAAEDQTDAVLRLSVLGDVAYATGSTGVLAGAPKGPFTNNIEQIIFPNAAGSAFQKHIVNGLPDATATAKKPLVIMVHGFM